MSYIEMREAEACAVNSHFLIQIKSNILRLVIATVFGQSDNPKFRLRVSGFNP